MSQFIPDWQHLSLKQKIGQMVVVRASGYLFDHQIRYPAWEVSTSKLKQWLEELFLGGIILLGGSAAELSLKTQQLQTWAKIPLLIAADIEEGVGQRFAGATWFPPPMALGAIAERNLTLAQNYATAMGKITAREAVAVGINWLLAPVVDVNNNPDNPVINIRAFGETPEIVSSLTAAFIKGTKTHPILTTAKHFPGHGDTTTDSHLDLPIIPHADSRLTELELPPFVSAIASGVDSIMTAHLLIPAWDRDYPATLSTKIVTDKLRRQLKFEGLIVTDALIMGGITQYADDAEIAIMAVEAGTDILLMPADPEVAIEGIYQAVRSGRLSQSRIEQSLQRIWQAKQRLFSSPVSQFSLPHFSAQLAQPEANQTVTSILQGSLQTGGNLPLKPQSERNLRNLIVVDDVLNCPFLDIQTNAVAIPQQLGYSRQIVDRNSLWSAQSDPRTTLLQVFIRGNPFRGTAGLTKEAQEFYQQLLRSASLAHMRAAPQNPSGSRQIHGLVIYGSPYVKDWFVTQIPKDLPWVFSYGQMNLAQEIALRVFFELSIAEKSSFEPSSFNDRANFGF